MIIIIIFIFAFINSSQGNIPEIEPSTPTWNQMLNSASYHEVLKRYADDDFDGSGAEPEGGIISESSTTTQSIIITSPLTTNSFPTVTPQSDDLMRTSLEYLGPSTTLPQSPETTIRPSRAIVSSPSAVLPTSSIIALPTTSIIEPTTSWESTPIVGLPTPSSTLPKISPSPVIDISTTPSQTASDYEGSTQSTHGNVSVEVTTASSGMDSRNSTGKVLTTQYTSGNGSSATEKTDEALLTKESTESTLANESSITTKVDGTLPTKESNSTDEFSPTENVTLPITKSPFGDAYTATVESNGTSSKTDSTPIENFTTENVNGTLPTTKSPFGDASIATVESNRTLSKTDSTPIENFTTENVNGTLPTTKSSFGDAPIATVESNGTLSTTDSPPIENFTTENVNGTLPTTKSSFGDSSIATVESNGTLLTTDSTPIKNFTTENVNGTVLTTESPFEFKSSTTDEVNGTLITKGSPSENASSATEKANGTLPTTENISEQRSSTTGNINVTLHTTEIPLRNESSETEKINGTLSTTESFVEDASTTERSNVTLTTTESPSGNASSATEKGNGTLFTPDSTESTSINQFSTTDVHITSATTEIGTSETMNHTLSREESSSSWTSINPTEENATEASQAGIASTEWTIAMTEKTPSTLHGSSTPTKDGGVFEESTATISTTENTGSEASITMKVTETSSTDLPTSRQPRLNLTKSPEERFWIRTMVQTKSNQLPKSFQQSLEGDLRTLYEMAWKKSEDADDWNRKKRSLQMERVNSSTSPKPNNSSLSQVDVQMLNITLDTIYDILHLIYVVIVNDELVPANIASVKVNMLTDVQVSSAFQYDVIRRAEPVLVRTPTPIPRKYNPARKYESHDWIIFIAVGVLSAVLLIIIIAVIVYKKCVKDTRHPIATLASSTSPRHRRSIFGHLNRQKIFRDKSYQINVGTGNEESEKLQSATDVRKGRETDKIPSHSSTAPMAPPARGSQSTIVQLHDTDFSGKKSAKSTNKSLEGHDNAAFESDEISTDNEEYGRYRVAPEKPPKNQINNAQIENEELESNVQLRARKPVDEIVPEVPVKMRKRSEDELFSHVRFSGPLIDPAYDPTILNHEEGAMKSTGPHPPSETYNMQITPKVIPVLHCTTTESSDHDVLQEIRPQSPDLLQSSTETAIVNVEEMKNKINNLLDDSFCLARDDRSGYASFHGKNKVEPMGLIPPPADRSCSLKADRSRNVASAPANRQQTGYNSPPRVEKPSHYHSKEDEREWIKYRKEPPPNHSSKVVWTTYSAADEIARNQDLQLTRDLSSYTQHQPSYHNRPETSRRTRKSNNVRPATAFPKPNARKALERDEIDIVNSLKSIEFEPAESVIRAIKDELEKYENLTYD